MKSILAILIFVEWSIPHVQSLILVCTVSLQFSQLDFPIEVSTLGLSAGALYGTLLLCVCGVDVLSQAKILLCSNSVCRPSTTSVIC